MLDTSLTGTNLIAGISSALGADRLVATDAVTGAALEPSFAVASKEEIAVAAQNALAAAPEFAATSAKLRAEFLEKIAVGLEGLGDILIERAHAESALPAARLNGERGRTVGQLRMFANLITEGSWVDARIDSALPDRKPLPRPDLRRMLIPLGPVAVYGASNFPLAFSVAGGDTASALAAGCPVVVKAHPAHPGTSELVGRIIVDAAKACGLPVGVFGMVHGDAAVGRCLAGRDEIAAIAFTGSLGAGRALFDLASSRVTPIPVYAEMGSVNPVVVLRGALDARMETLAKGYADSLTLGVGQFCTNPGLLIGLKGEQFQAFLNSVGEHLAAYAGGTMLTDGIYERYVAGKRCWTKHRALTDVFTGEDKNGKATPGLFTVSAQEFMKSPELSEEVFGPAAIAIECESEAELLKLVQKLPGQLTATLHFEAADSPLAKQLLPLLTKVAGRVLANGFPTGVEVSPAMQHGGPYPATSDSRSTSVGTAAILRFVRPVCYQDIPDELLPLELQRTNPLGIWRTFNGSLSKDPG